jgi:hypothetical protein
MPTVQAVASAHTATVDLFIFHSSSRRCLVGIGAAIPDRRAMEDIVKRLNEPGMRTLAALDLSV